MSEQTAVVSRRRRMVGQVVSNKMDKTAVVAVETIKQHPLYRKTIRTTKRYKAHDENNEAQIGDVVRIEESRPLSHEADRRPMDERESQQGDTQPWRAPTS